MVFLALKMPSQMSHMTFYMESNQKLEIWKLELKKTGELAWKTTFYK